MFTDFISIQYCYDYLINQIPVGLLLYSHIPTALAALAFGAYVVLHVRRLSSVTLFVVCLAFATWCFFDLSSWFAFLGSQVTMFTWSLLDLLALIFFLFSYYFLYVFVTEHDLPLWQKILGTLLILPTAAWTFLGMNLTGFEANYCEALEHEAIALYPYFVQAFILLSSIVLIIWQYRRSATKERRHETLLAGTGVLLFLGFFFTATLGVNLLVNYFENLSDYAYNFEIYGLFGMPVLLIYLGYLIVRYQAFDLKVFGAQALVMALIAVIASEFAFINSTPNRVLVSITLFLTALSGLILIRSVKREIEQREHIERLAKDLERANDQQVVLIHFITHQIKGFVTKSRNIFASLLDGAYGQLPESMQNLVEEGLRSDTKGAATIQQILDASNMKSGKMAYKNEQFDLKELVDEVVKDLKQAADAKHLTLTVTCGEGSFTMTGDRMQMLNALKNLIDNSIKYTPTGSVTVNLTKEEGKIRFKVEDTGVGITPEDMQLLFTEGGHGKESTKVNVDSTGFGLYIVKNIIEAHQGKVWAESEGAGKGSRFIVELPA